MSVNAVSYRARPSGGAAGDATETIFLATNQVEALRRALLAWYAANRRDLAWRRTRDPYAIWVSEIMLQQTRVVAVEERYASFMRTFSTVQALADASEAEVLAQWSGLGYYRRARMLHKAAKMVVQELAGTLPASATGLRALPGVGVYTSAAIASIAHGEAIAVVDGNVERVVQRLAGWGNATFSTPTRLAQETAKTAQFLLDPAHPGDFNQAVMELGATVCLPRAPQCLACPLNEYCKTRGEHPVAPRAPMRSQDAAYALIIRSAGRHREVLLEQRGPGETVMPGMWELPALRELEVAGADLRMAVRHSIMQVNYYVRIRTVFEDDAEALTMPSESRRWVRLHDLPVLPLTGLARKVLLRAGLPELSPAPEFSHPAEAKERPLPERPSGDEHRNRGSARPASGRKRPDGS